MDKKQNKKENKKENKNKNSKKWAFRNLGKINIKVK